MAIKAPRILYFIDGPVPNAANKIEANAMRGNGAIVCFRNARFVGGDGNDGSIEPSDGVAGRVPTEYEGQPTAAVAISKYSVALDAEAKTYPSAADNMGTASLPNPAIVPFAAPVRTETAPAAPPPAPPAPAIPAAPVAAPAAPGAPAFGAPAFGAPPAPPAPQQ